MDSELGQRADSSNKYRNIQPTKGLRATAHGRNDDCQVTVDEQGMVVALPGQVLTIDRPVSGVVSDAEYAYYVVSAISEVFKMCTLIHTFPFSLLAFKRVLLYQTDNKHYLR